jgi:hypothetical protein
VIYDPAGQRLLSIAEIVPAVSKLADPAFDPSRQRGWRVSGLEDGDARGVYTRLTSIEYLAGYAGPPPMVHLRSGETLRRYLRPGLDDGKTFVFWGRNYMTKATPGPERDRTWVNQPQKMYGSTSGTGFREGQARYANAVYEYRPNFADGSYHQGVINESADHVTFEFYTPFVIAATPPNDKPWGVYDAGAKNGLVIHVSRAPATASTVQVSTDQGRTWQGGSSLSDGLDLTDLVKGCQQYFLRFDGPIAALKEAGVSWTTVCQANASTMPHLHDGENLITYAAGGSGIVAAGPLVEQAASHLVEGMFDSPKVTLELAAPRGAKPLHVYAAAWQASGNPPSSARYAIEYSIDGGKMWRPVVKDWSIERRPPEPGDYWSQSFTWGDAAVEGAAGGKPVRVRFSNDGGKPLRKAEAYLAYEVAGGEAEVTFRWDDASGKRQTASHAYAASVPGTEGDTWRLDAGQKPQTVWVETRAK